MGADSTQLMRSSSTSCEELSISKSKKRGEIKSNIITWNECKRVESLSNQADFPPEKHDLKYSAVRLHPKRETE